MKTEHSDTVYTTGSCMCNAYIIDKRGKVVCCVLFLMTI